MEFFGKLTTYLPNDSKGFTAVGFAEKYISVETVESAQKEAEEWVRRNRLANPEHPGMRFRVELFVGEQSAWSYDETKGDAPLEPTEETVLTCSI